MRFSDITKSITAQMQFSATNNSQQVVPYLEGAPGGGKSALASLIGREGLTINNASTPIRIPFQNVIQFFASLREPQDILGLPKIIPSTNSHTPYSTYWIPPEELQKLAIKINPENGKPYPAEQQPYNLLIIEELSDCNIAMQNALCGLIYDRKVNNLHLSPNTFIIATGNRTKDKSGANRLASKLYGRLRLFQYEENLDDFIAWGQQQKDKTKDEEDTSSLPNGHNQNIDPVLLSFLRFKPNYLSDFDPDRPANPTPRTWERVSNTPLSLFQSSQTLYMQTIAGDVGEGAATEYVAFRRIHASLPDVKELLKTKDAAIMSRDTHLTQIKEPSILYAISGALPQHVTARTLPNLFEYIKGMPPEFQVIVAKDLMAIKPRMAKSDEFSTWALAHSNLLV